MERLVRGKLLLSESFGAAGAEKTDRQRRTERLISCVPSQFLSSTRVPQDRKLWTGGGLALLQHAAGTSVRPSAERQEETSPSDDYRKKPEARTCSNRFGLGSVRRLSACLKPTK